MNGQIHGKVDELWVLDRQSGEAGLISRKVDSDQAPSKLQT